MTSTTRLPAGAGAPGSVGPLLRRIRHERPLLVLVVVLVGVVALAVALLPRALERAGRQGLQVSIGAAEPSSRGIVGEDVGVVPDFGGDPLAGLGRVAAAAWGQLPAVLAEHLEPPTSLVDSIRYAVVPLEGEDPLPLPTFLTLRAHEGIDGQLELVSGRMPRTTDDERQVGEGPGRFGVTIVEVLLTPRTAEETGLAIGDEVLGLPDLNDLVVRRRSFDQQIPVVVRVVGLAELTDAAAPFWFGDARLHRPAQQETGSGVNLFPFAILTSESLRSLPDVVEHIPLRMEFRSVLAADDLAPAEVHAIRDEVRRIEAGVTTGGEVRWRTGLGRLLDQHLGQVAGARAAALVAMTGVLAVAVVVIALVGLLLATRRRASVALVRGRGASGRQLLAAEVAAAVALTVPVALAALAIAGALVPGTGGRDSILLVAGVVALGVAALVGAAVPDLRRPLRDVLEPYVDRRTGSSLRRRTAEVSLVLVTGAAVVALRRRGVVVGEADGTDPLLLVTPVLLAAAVAVAAVRLHRVPLRLATLLAREGRGAATLVGLARATRSARTGAPLAVLLVATTVTIVAMSLDVSVRQGQVEASWRAVGAPYRLAAAAGESLPELATDDLPGATDRARDTRLVAPVVEPAAVAGRVEVAMVELDRYARLTAGTPAEIEVPLRLLTAAPTRVEGDDPAPIPALASRDWAGEAGVGAGDVLTVLLGDTLAEVRILGTRSTFLDLQEDTRGFLVLPLSHVEAVVGRSFGTGRLYVDAPPDAGAGLAGVAAELGAGVLDRGAWLADVRSSPLTAMVLATLRAAAGFALLLAALALSTSLAVTGRQRARDLALLGLLGGTRRQTAVAGLAEVLPAVVLAAAVGGALGAATVVLLRRPLDLAPLTGDASLALALPTTVIVVVAGGIALLASLLAAVHALAARGAHPRTVLEEVDR